MKRGGRLIGAWRLLGLCALLAISAGSTAVQAATLEESPPAQMRVPDFATLVKRYGAAVVNISVTHEVGNQGSSCRPASNRATRLRRFSRAG